MVPIPMNEFLQQNLANIGVDLTFDVVEWGTMLVAFRAAPDAPQSHGDDAVNISLGYTDPGTMARFFETKSFSPGATNWGHYSNPKVDAALEKAQATFDKEEQISLLRSAHETIVDDAAWLFICHDLNPRAMSKQVKGFEPAQSWYQDFTQITMG
jgi:ABC-type transport system substrate-binding protein